VTGLEPEDLTVDALDMRHVAELGGSISSEHGIGTAKRPWLRLSRSEAELSAFRRSKRHLILRAFLNPSILLPTGW
jgi:FAD/FMN-containing dehydrogenase